MNYRSAVVFGRAVVVDGDEKMAALKAISEHLRPGSLGRGPGAERAGDAPDLGPAPRRRRCRRRPARVVRSTNPNPVLLLWAGVLPRDSRAAPPRRVSGSDGRQPSVSRRRFISATSDCLGDDDRLRQVGDDSSAPWSTAYRAMSGHRGDRGPSGPRRGRRAPRRRGVGYGHLGLGRHPGCSVSGAGVMPIHAMALSRSSSGCPSPPASGSAHDSPAWTRTIPSPSAGTSDPSRRQVLEHHRHPLQV